MAWVIGAGLVVFVLIGIANNPAFRRVVFTVVGVLGAGFLWFWYDIEVGRRAYQVQRQVEEQARAAATLRRATLIPFSAIELADILLDLKTGWLSVTVKNHSPYGLGGLRVRALIRDCEYGAGARCEIVGDVSQSVSIHVPVGQVRGVRINLRDGLASLPRLKS